MKIQIASDLHLECRRLLGVSGLPLAPAPGAEVLVLAGDIDSHTHMLDAFADWPVPVVYVNGNHEAYDSHYFGLQSQLRQKAEGTAVHYLEKDEWVYQGTRFLGCCLWTDYALLGDAASAMALARKVMPDHGHIRVAGGASFSPQIAWKVHRQSVAWLREQLAKPFPGKTVVVTHHAPHPGSIAPAYAGSPLNPAFCSNLGSLVEAADLWVHGHTHASLSYVVGNCHVVANPLGYPRQTDDGYASENANFEPVRVIPVR